MELPFSQADFFLVFNHYNQAIWPAQLLATAMGAAAMLLLVTRWRWADRFVSATLCALWAFTGIAYHWTFFAAINQAAHLFGALFLLAAVIFAWEGVVRSRLRFRLERGAVTWMALILITYAIGIYPLLGLLVTHPYPETPLFGVVPCPTTIFTLALLMLAEHPRPLYVAAVPLAWSVIGGSAAWLLAVPQDWGLFAAALGWVVAYVTTSRPPAASSGRST